MVGGRGQCRAGGPLLRHTPPPTTTATQPALARQQLRQLLPDVGVHPAVHDRVGDRRGHGDHVTHGQSDVERLRGVWGSDHLRDQGEHAQRRPADGKQDGHNWNIEGVIAI